MAKSPGLGGARWVLSGARLIQLFVASEPNAALRAELGHERSDHVPPFKARRGKVEVVAGFPGTLAKHDATKGGEF